MYAIATLVMNGDKYVPGAICLAKSIRRHMTKDEVDMVCMVTDDVPIDDLELWYDHVVCVDRISVNSPSVGGKRATGIYTWNSDAPTKWNILGLTTYDKVLFMDADMIVMDTIMDLFSLPVPAAVFDHQITSEYSRNPLWTGRKEGKGFINWYKVAIGLEHPKKGSKGHLRHGTRISRYAVGNLYSFPGSQFALQGGIVLLEPNEDTLSLFKDEVHTIVSDIRARTDTTLSAIDEISLTLFYHNHGYQWNHIDIRYNVAAYHMYAMYDDIKVMHYISTYKPWFTRPDGLSEREYIRKASTDSRRDPSYRYHHQAVELWWDIYDDK